MTRSFILSNQFQHIRIKNILSKKFVYILLLLIFYPGIEKSYAAYPDDYPNKLNILKHLRENKIEQLEEGFNKLQ